MGDPTSVAIEALTKDNYKTWRMQAEALLEVCDLWTYVGEDKEMMPKDVDRREFWMKRDKIAKSKLILHISSALLPLVEDCSTSREVWLKLANVYGNNKGVAHEGSIENSDTDDQDAIVNCIESIVEEFFEVINKSPSLKITEHKNSLSTIFANELFALLNGNGIKKLPDKEIISNTVIDYIDVIDELSETEMKNRTSELSAKLIDILLMAFNINPYENDSNEAGSNADEAEIRDDDIDGDGKEENKRVSNKLDSFYSRDFAGNHREAISENAVPTKNEFHEIIGIYKSLRSESQYDNERIPACEIYGKREYTDSVSPLISLHTPPPTPFPKKTYKCGVCRNEGHNRTRCPLNRTAVSASKIAVEATTSPKRSYKCGVCGNEGHNRTTCPLNKPAAATLPSIARASETPKRAYKCGICGVEGHNRTTCSLNKAAASASKYTAGTTGAPKRSYKCGVCGNEGHNRTTCPLNKPAAATLPSTARVSETPKRAYKCGICRGEGHNRTTCPLNKPAASASIYTAVTTEVTKRSYRCGGCGNEGHNIRSCPSMTLRISPPKPAAVSTPARSYTCGLCGGEGHNRTTCTRNLATSSASTRAAPRCSTCGGEGHNSRTCGRRAVSSASYYTAPSYSSYSSYSSPAPSYSGGRRSYSCGNCGGAGHNRRTCTN